MFFVYKLSNVLEFSDIALSTFDFNLHPFLAILVFCYISLSSSPCFQRTWHIFSVLPWLKPGFLLPMCRCDVCAQTCAHLPLPAIILPDSCHCPDLGQCGLHGFWSDWRIVSFHSLLKAEIKTTTLGYHCDSQEYQTRGREARRRRMRRREVIWAKTCRWEARGCASMRVCVFVICSETAPKILKKNLTKLGSCEGFVLSILNFLYLFFSFRQKTSRAHFTNTCEVIMTVSQRTTIVFKDYLTCEEFWELGQHIEIFSQSRP